ncbi:MULTISPECIES: glycine oxidase ThiO [Thiorhodovibrio]|uniref:glycine oxidase ThiO n=1 Tax=Thiorhodovibrio TaxID=61593 RepID=UPI0019127FE9|nr:MULTISPECIES: glycine oxidase ThiO [Thiorhodovibrio]MBK5968465.1 glycine oxidase ThiO [Thiorhodovibrio winogradskyi]WPL11108.1 Hydrogen cyanide synthase subunit HcnC precursor [Thiorhodovibrio litoralis]
MSDYLIVGGGVIGLMTAYELAKTEASVTLIEMRDTGRQSSWAGGGILSPLYPWHYPASVNALAFWSQAYYPQFIQELLDKTGVDPEYRASGLMILDAAERDLGLAWGERHSIPVELLDRAGVAAQEPNLELELDNALWLPSIAQVRNPRLTRSLRAAIDKKVKIRENEEVIDLRIQNGRVEGVRTTAGQVAADRVVVCAGAWTAQLLEHIGQAPNIRPVRGQMMLFFAKPDQIRHVTLYRERYIIPRQDGRVLIGSTLAEEAGFNKSTTSQAKEELYRFAVELYPLLKRAPIEDHWAGLRPGSPKGVPYIGAYPGVEGLFVNAGHFSTGLVTGPASARLISDLMLERSPIVSPEPYALETERD